MTVRSFFAIGWAKPTTLSRAGKPAISSRRLSRTSCLFWRFDVRLSIAWHGFRRRRSKMRDDHTGDCDLPGQIGGSKRAPASQTGDLLAKRQPAVFEDCQGQD